MHSVHASQHTSVSVKGTLTLTFPLARVVTTWKGGENVCSTLGKPSSGALSPAYHKSYCCSSQACKNRYILDGSCMAN